MDNRPALACTERGPAARSSGAPTLAFLHYYGGSAAEWAAVADRLSPRFRCLLPDLRGFGDSAASDVPDTWSVGDAADDVLALLADRVRGGVVLVGHSMGGKIALALAARRPAGLKALVLVAPSPPTPEPIADEVRARLLATHGSRDAAVEGAEAITVRPPGSAPFERVVADNLRTAPGAWRAWLLTGSREDISPAMDRVSVPVLAVSGDGDTTIPTDVVRREVAGRVPGARLEVVAGARHLIPLDRPAELADLIAGFAAGAHAA